MSRSSLESRGINFGKEYNISRSRSTFRKKNKQKVNIDRERVRGSTYVIAFEKVYRKFLNKESGVYEKPMTQGVRGLS